MSSAMTEAAGVDAPNSKAASAQFRTPGLVTAPTVSERLSAVMRRRGNGSRVLGDAVSEIETRRRRERDGALPRPVCGASGASRRHSVAETETRRRRERPLNGAVRTAQGVRERAGQKAGGADEGGKEMPDIGVADGEVNADGGSERDHPGQSDGLMQMPDGRPHHRQSIVVSPIVRTPPPKPARSWARSEVRRGLIWWSSAAEIPMNSRSSGTKVSPTPTRRMARPPTAVAPPR